MGFLSRPLCVTIAAGLLAGCSAGPQASPSALPGSIALARVPVPGLTHIYVSENSNANILGYAYPSENHANSGPNCTVAGVKGPHNIATDAHKDLIDPDSGTDSILIYGPGWCAAQAAAIPDPYGEPVDAASNNALSGKIAVANITDFSSVNGGAGSIAVCTVHSGCTQNLTNSSMAYVGGVAMANNGDCWASAVNSSGGAELVYFANCTGGGVVQSGFSNNYYGGLDIDKTGYIVSEDEGHIWVYKGCESGCNVLSGPWAMHNYSVYAHLNSTSTYLAAADNTNGAIDLYKYKPEHITYAFSFTSGLSVSEGVLGVAWLPRSRE